MEDSDDNIVLDADNYSIKNCSISAGLSSTIFFCMATPFDVVKVRTLKDINNCDPLHYNNKSIFRTFRGLNPGIQEACTSCFKTTNTMVNCASIVKGESLSTLMKGFQYASGLGFLRASTNILVYENSIFLTFNIS